MSGAQRRRRVWSEQGSQPTLAATSCQTLVVSPPPLVARVIVGPVPDIRPHRSPTSSIRRRRRRTGRRLGVQTASEPYDAADLKAYAEWRGSWERTWELGPLTQPAGRCNASSPAWTTSPAWRRSSERSSRRRRRRGSSRPSVSDLPAQLDAVRAAIAGRGREGMAIVDQTPRRRSTVGFSRTWTTPVGAASCSPPTARTARPGRSHRRVGRGRPGRRVTDASPTSSRPTCGARSWWSRTAAVRRSSSKRRPPDRSPGSCRRRCAGRSGRSREVVVWSALFSRLPDALRVAAATDGVISFTIDRDS